MDRTAGLRVVADLWRLASKSPFARLSSHCILVQVLSRVVFFFKIPVFACYGWKMPCSPAQGFLQKALWHSDFFIRGSWSQKESLLIPLIAGEMREQPAQVAASLGSAFLCKTNPIFFKGIKGAEKAVSTAGLKGRGRAPIGATFDILASKAKLPEPRSGRHC